VQQLAVTVVSLCWPIESNPVLHLFMRFCCTLFAWQLMPFTHTHCGWSVGSVWLLVQYCLPCTCHALHALYLRYNQYHDKIQLLSDVQLFENYLEIGTYWTRCCFQHRTLHTVMVWLASAMPQRRCCLPPLLPLPRRRPHIVRRDTGDNISSSPVAATWTRQHCEQQQNAGSATHDN